MAPSYSNHVRAVDLGLPLYFDLQARMGHTKHLGGSAATQRLAELCALGPGQTVLNVGSGSGISAAYVVEKYGCRVVGLDILPGMVASAEKWAQERGLTDRMEFHLGDAQELPFDDCSFDAVICESVNVFVPDKPKAIGEYMRVVKPGGFVGLNEAIWMKIPSDRVAAIINEATGQEFQPPQFWQDLLLQAGLVDLVVEKHAMTMRGEARNQSGLLTFRSYLKILGRTAWLLLTDREIRSLLKYMASNPSQYFEFMGYGLYVGRKPVSETP